MAQFGFSAVNVAGYRAQAASVAAIAAAMLVSAWTAPARAAETPSAFCQRVGTDDTQQPIPESLVSAVNAAFAMQLPPRVAVDTTVFRCADRHVLVCTTGANLPCGKANTNRSPSPGGVQWCHDNRDAAFVPAFATGHDTIYQWRCNRGTPQIVRQTQHVDRRGFISEFWKPLS